MRSIGVLYFMRKKKRTARVSLPVQFSVSFRIVASLFVALFFLAAAGNAIAEKKSVHMGTFAVTEEPSGDAITKDPATGTRLMRTTKPEPVPPLQGPQTIIVAPEVFPNIQEKPPYKPVRPHQKDSLPGNKTGKDFHHSSEKK